MQVGKMICLICLLQLAACLGMGQTRIIDSLKTAVNSTASPKEKLQLISLLNDQSINADSILPYVVMAEKICAKDGNQSDRQITAYCRANYYARKNILDSAMLITEDLISNLKNDNNQQELYLKVLFFKAKVYDRGNQYSKALDQLVDVIEKAESLHDTLAQIQAKTGIGWVQIEMEQYHDALKWLYKALNTSSNQQFYKSYGALYSNIASAYNSLGNEDSAMHYINIGIKNARENENLLFLATSLSMQAKMYIDNKKPHLAEVPLHEVLEIRKKLNDAFYTVYDMSNLASYYASNGQSQKGIALCNEGIALAKQYKLSSQLLMIYHSLAENYKTSGKTQEYSQTLEYIMALKDSFNNINSSKQISELQAKNEVQKNEKTIVEQKLNLTIKNYWLFGSAIFAIMAAIIIWLVFKNNNRRQKIKMQLALEEEKRNAAQSIIDAEEQERKRIAADLHDNIGAYASAIRADVEKITDNGLEIKNVSLQNLQQHSQEIINSLRDTIWVLNKEHITITGVSDRIKNYLNKLQPSYDHIQFHIKEEIRNDARLSSQLALNIFRIVQEAIHNALKHSNAANISIKINSATTVIINIIDDGQGMSSTTGNKDGNGLLNMKARAKEAGMQLDIVTKINEGTSLLLQATTN